MRLRRRTPDLSRAVRTRRRRVRTHRAGAPRRRTREPMPPEQPRPQCSRELSATVAGTDVEIGVSPDCAVISVATVRATSTAAKRQTTINAQRTTRYSRRSPARSCLRVWCSTAVRPRGGSVAPWRRRRTAAPKHSAATHPGQTVRAVDPVAISVCKGLSAMCAASWLASDWCRRTRSVPATPHPAAATATATQRSAIGPRSRKTSSVRCASRWGCTVAL